MTKEVLGKTNLYKENTKTNTDERMRERECREDEVRKEARERGRENPVQ